MQDRGKASYVIGRTDIDLLHMTIGQCLETTARKFPDREALVVCHQGVRLTYRQLREEVLAFAAGLLALGLQPGDRLGIWSPNNAQWLITQLATAQIGVILVNINPAYRLSELSYVLNKVQCKALVATERFKSSHYIEMLYELAPELARCAPGALEAEHLPSLKTVIRLGQEHTPGMFNFDEIAPMAQPQHHEQMADLAARLKPEDAINIQFTSGTTGLPKGATLSHHNILNNGYLVTENLRFTEADRLCLPVPLYHCFGMVMGNLGCISHGATVVYPSDAFDPLAVLQAIEQERCTVLYGVPTMFLSQLEHPEFDRFDTASLRTGIMSGAPCPLELMNRVVNDMHMTGITICYGMTETSPVIFQCLVDDPLERRVTTVGAVMPHTEAKIVDENDQTLPLGEKGQIVTRGFHVMQGYWNDEAATRSVIDSEGWMHTGDLGTLDEAGYCAIVGRIKDMVIRGGENIYPREVEEFLLTHPEIIDVQCFGITDETYGEVLCAWVQGKPGLTAESVKAFCQGQIAHYKIPTHVELVDAFPMTVTGKIQKFIMREAMQARLQGRSETASCATLSAT